MTSDSGQAAKTAGAPGDLRPWEGVLLAVQYVGFLSLHLILALLVCRAAKASGVETEAVLSRSLLVAGLATALQAHRGRWLGAGYFVPSNLVSVIYVSASLSAAHHGGLPAVFGLTLMAGAIELILSLALPHLLHHITPRMIALVMVMLGVEVAAGGAGEILTTAGHSAPSPEILGLSLAGATLLISLLCSMTSVRLLRRYGTLIALIVGLTLGALFYHLAPEGLALLGSSDWVRVPSLFGGLAFNGDLVPAFAIGGVVATMKAVGAVSLAQKVQGQPVDIARSARGAAVDGVATLVAGLIGTLGVNTSPSAVALSQTSGASHRYLGYYLGALLATLAFFPRLMAGFMAVPTPVVGALLFFLGSTLLLRGLKDLFSPGWGEFEQWTLGFPMAVGLTRVFYPAAFEAAPAALRPFIDSPMTLTVLVVPLMLLLAALVGLQRGGEL